MLRHTGSRLNKRRIRTLENLAVLPRATIFRSESGDAIQVWADKLCLVCYSIRFSSTNPADVLPGLFDERFSQEPEDALVSDESIDR